MLKLFDSQILPILEYGSEIWYFGKNISHYEAVHLGFLKFALGVKRQTSSLAIYGETGRYPLYMRQQDRAVKLWLRLKFSNSHKPINHVFDELMTLHSLGHDTWIRKIKMLMGDTFDNIPENIDLRALTSQLRDVRYKSFVENWLENINDTDKNPILRTYCKFKTDFTREAYLQHSNTRKYFTNISRFRTSSHSLHIETGRHTIPITSISDRICQ